MKFNFRDLTVDNARVIADTWKYPGEYSFYDMHADPEDYQEFISPERWTGQDLQVVAGDDLQVLVVEPAKEGVVTIGLGVRPDLTGQGRGAGFVAACLDHIRQELPTIHTVTLTVADFNRRAIRTYLRNGFTQVGTHAQETNGAVFEFCDMEVNLWPRD